MRSINPKTESTIRMAMSMNTVKTIEKIGVMSDASEAPRLF